VGRGPTKRRYVVLAFAKFRHTLSVSVVERGVRAPRHERYGAGVSKGVDETTDPAATERRLRESEMRFRALTNATSDVVYRMSPDWLGGRGRHIESRRTRHLLGRAGDGGDGGHRATG